MKKSIAMVLAVMMMLVGIVPALAATNTGSASVNTTAYVATSNRGTLNVRADADAEAAIIDTLNYGTQVTVVEYVNSIWVRILYIRNSRTQMGYVMMKHLSFTKPNVNPNPTPSSAPSISSLNFSSFRQVSPYKVYANPTRTTGWVNMRWAPSTDVDVIERCYQYYELVVIAQNNSWAQVYDPKNGCVGFMDRKFLRESGVGVAISVQ